MKKQWLAGMFGCLLAMLFGFLVLPIQSVYADDIDWIFGEQYQSGEYTYVVREDGMAMITQYENKTYTLCFEDGRGYWVDEHNQKVERPVIYLPSELDGHPVIAIQSNTFGIQMTDADVFIPNSLLLIEPGAFYDAAVYRYLIAPDHPKYMLIADMLYEKDTMRLVDWAGTRDQSVILETLIIPEGTRIIGKFALEGAVAKEIILPESLESIEDAAFNRAFDLEKISIPDGVTHIGQRAFNACSRLKEVTLPSGLISVGADVFHSCAELEKVTLPDEIKELPPGMFAYCLKLRQVKLPADLERIGDGAFYLCCELESMTLPETVKHIEEWAYYGCRAMKQINLPEGLTEIGSEAFGNCNSLTEITLPMSLREVDVANGDFIAEFPQFPFLTSCANLERIYVSPDHPVFTVVDGALIRKADGMLIAYPQAIRAEHFTVPASIRKIGNRAFYGHKYLKSVVISEGVTDIGEKAFFECANLQDLTLPMSLKADFLQLYTIQGYDKVRIGHDVIGSNRKLREISITSGLTEAEYRANEEKILQLLENANVIMAREMEERDENVGIIPYAMTEERYEEIMSKLSRKDYKKVSQLYRKVSPDSLYKLTDENRMTYLELYPALQARTLYILKDDINKVQNTQKYLADAGYTMEDYQADLQYVNPQYMCSIEKGVAEKKIEYSFENGLMQPFVRMNVTEVLRNLDESMIAPREEVYNFSSGMFFRNGEVAQEYYFGGPSF